MRNVFTSVPSRAKWWGLFTAVAVALVSLTTTAQDTAVKKAPSANGKATAAPAVTGGIKLYDAGGNVFLTTTKKVKVNTNAFDFLRHTIVVDFTTFPPNLSGPKPFPGGPFVNALAGVPPDSGTYWALYIDGKYSCVGISSITIEKDISIEWKMEKFDVKHPECD